MNHEEKVKKNLKKMTPNLFLLFLKLREICERRNINLYRKHLIMTKEVELGNFGTTETTLKVIEDLIRNYDYYIEITSNIDIPTEYKEELGDE